MINEITKKARLYTMKYGYSVFVMSSALYVLYSTYTYLSQFLNEVKYGGVSFFSGLLSATFSIGQVAVEGFLAVYFVTLLHGIYRNLRKEKLS